jgi:hypothetical protein
MGTRKSMILVPLFELKSREDELPRGLCRGLQLGGTPENFRER